MFAVADILSNSPGPIHVVDVGALSMGEDTERYAPLLKAGLASVIGFEPVEAECEKLNAIHGPQHRFYPYAIGDGSARTFHIGASTRTSSLYEPNMPLLEKFQSLAELSRVVGTQQVQTRRLDDLPFITDIDYLKLDVQGAEVDVMRGSERLLSGTMVVETEVEFVEMYKGQPLFGDVDAAMRSYGFLFHKVLDTGGRAFKPTLFNNHVESVGSQTIWANALYVKSFMDFDRLPPTKLLKLAILLDGLFGSPDLAYLALQTYGQLTGQRLCAAYLQRKAQQESQR